VLSNKPWDEIICHLCDTKKVEDEKYFLLKFPAYTHFRSQFHKIYNNTNIPNLFTHQNYRDLGNLPSIIFNHRNEILKQCK
jgi:hypothetical protein